MKVLTLNDCWLAYLVNVIPVGAPATQIRESKRAFFAGAGALFGKIGQTADLSQEAAFSILNEISAELASFSYKVRTGQE